MKKFLALVLCLAMVMSLSVMAFAEDTSDDESKAEAVVGAKVEKKEPTEQKTAADYLEEMKKGAAATTWTSPVVDYAKAAKAAWEAGLAASEAYLSLTNAYAQFGKDVLKTTQSAAQAAVKAAIGTYVNEYKGIINQVISLEFQDAAMKVSNEMEKAIAELQYGLENFKVPGYDITPTVDVSALIQQHEFSYVPMEQPADSGSTDGGSGSGETPAPTTEG